MKTSTTSSVTTADYWLQLMGSYNLKLSANINPKFFRGENGFADGPKVEALGMAIHPDEQGIYAAGDVSENRTYNAGIGYLAVHGGQEWERSRISKPLDLNLNRACGVERWEVAA